MQSILASATHILNRLSTHRATKGSAHHLTKASTNQDTQGSAHHLTKPSMHQPTKADMMGQDCQATSTNLHSRPSPSPRIWIRYPPRYRYHIIACPRNLLNRSKKTRFQSRRTQATVMRRDRSTRLLPRSARNPRLLRARLQLQQRKMMSQGKTQLCHQLYVYISHQHLIC
jgi:hypothetical protein